MAETFIAYYRVSTARQGQSGLGLEAQRTAVMQFAAQRGGVVLMEFVEVESGRRSDRPELAKALAEARKRKATLCIAKLDRLARNVAFISGLMEAGVPFLATDMPTADRFMLHIFAAMAEEEARRISQRTKAALAAAKARGTVLGAFGTELASRNIAEAEAFARRIAPVVRSVQADGFSSLRSMAEELNRRAVPTANGGRWHALTVKRVVERMAASMNVTESWRSADVR